MLPPGQQLVARDKWPLVGERTPKDTTTPWQVSVVGEVANPLELPVEELRTLPWTEQVVDIHCVTRWSKPGVRFGGVLLADLLTVAMPVPKAEFVSFVAHSTRRHSTSLPLAVALELGTMLAMEADGRPLGAEHGGPIRVVVPKRYFYKSLKWLWEIELLVEDRLGHWEGTAGYHNEADPWQEQRYVAEGLTKQQAASILEQRDIRGQELRNLVAAGLELPGLEADSAVLRNADFRGANLAGANFAGANLSNAHFDGATLAGAKFTLADVEGADFRGADMRGADFSGASLIGVSFCEPFDYSQGVSEFRKGAMLDASTRIDPLAIESLTPDQVAYLQSIGVGSRS